MQQTVKNRNNYKYKGEFIGALIYHQLIFSMKQLNLNFILPFNITIPKLDSSKHNCQSFDSSCDKICVENGRLSIQNDDGKLDLYHTVEIRYPVIKDDSSVLFIECTDINRKTSYVIGLCISILLNNMGWYLGVIGKLHNDECLIYILTGNVEMLLKLFRIKHCIILGIKN